MGANDTHRQFDKIITQLTADYPSLAGQRRCSRRALITGAVAGGLLWALLSVAMVAWSATGIVLAGVAVAVIGTGVALDVYRRRRR